MVNSSLPGALIIIIHIHPHFVSLLAKKGIVESEIYAHLNWDVEISFCLYTEGLWGTPYIAGKEHIQLPETLHIIYPDMHMQLIVSYKQKNSNISLNWYYNLSN